MPKSLDFCTIDEKGRVSDRSLHADILGDDDFGEEPKAPEGETEADVSDLDEIDDLIEQIESKEGAKPKA